MLDTQRLKQGADVEKLFIEKIRSLEGVDLIIPMSQAIGNAGRGNAPLLITTVGGSIVSPDFLIMINGLWQWCEVKSKDRSSWYRRYEREEYPIDYYSFLTYQEVEAISQIPVYLYIYEEAVNEWRFISIKDASLWGEKRDRFPARGGGFLIPKLRMTPIF